MLGGDSSRPVSVYFLHGSVVVAHRSRGVPGLPVEIIGGRGTPVLGPGPPHCSCIVAAPRKLLPALKEARRRRSIDTRQTRKIAAGEQTFPGRGKSDQNRQIALLYEYGMRIPENFGGNLASSPSTSSIMLLSIKLFTVAALIAALAGASKEDASKELAAAASHLRIQQRVLEAMAQLAEEQGDEEEDSGEEGDSGEDGDEGEDGGDADEDEDGGETAPPTPAPSPAPSAAPTTKSCSDSTTWFVKKERNNCAWVAKSPSKRCNKNGEDQGVQKVKAKERCQLACAES